MEQLKQLAVKAYTFYKDAANIETPSSVTDLTSEWVRDPALCDGHGAHFVAIRWNQRGTRYYHSYRLPELITMMEDGTWPETFKKLCADIEARS